MERNTPRIAARITNGRTEVYDRDNGEVLAVRQSGEDMTAGELVAAAVNARIDDYNALFDHAFDRRAFVLHTILDRATRKIRK